FCAPYCLAAPSEAASARRASGGRSERNVVFHVGEVAHAARGRLVRRLAGRRRALLLLLARSRTAATATAIAATHLAAAEAALAATAAFAPAQHLHLVGHDLGAVA